MIPVYSFVNPIHIDLSVIKAGFGQDTDEYWMALDAFWSPEEKNCVLFGASENQTESSV